MVDEAAALRRFREEHAGVFATLWRRMGEFDLVDVSLADAYLAAMVHGLLAGWPWPRIGRLASAWGAEVASVRGATPIIDAATRDALIARIQ